jgi:hypothetical protein
MGIPFFSAVVSASDALLVDRLVAKKYMLCARSAPRITDDCHLQHQTFTLLFV